MLVLNHTIHAGAVRERYFPYCKQPRGKSDLCKYLHRRVSYGNPTLRCWLVACAELRQPHTTSVFCACVVQVHLRTPDCFDLATRDVLLLPPDLEPKPLLVTLPQPEEQVGVGLMRNCICSVLGCFGLHFHLPAFARFSFVKLCYYWAAFVFAWRLHDFVRFGAQLIPKLTGFSGWCQPPALCAFTTDDSKPP